MKKIVIIFLLLSLSACTNKPAQTPSEVKNDVILEAEDFCFTDKEKNLAIWLGMDKEECLSIVGPAYHEYSGSEYPDEAYSSSNIYLVFHKNTLTRVRPSTNRNKNWESYQGINNETTKNDISEIFGQPTHQYPPFSRDGEQYSGKLVYIFNKSEDGEYIKVKNIEELEKLVRNYKVAREMRVFMFGYDDNTDKVSFTIEYLAPFDSFFIRDRFWRVTTGIHKWFKRVII